MSRKKGLLVYTILKYQSRKDIAKENTSKPSPKKGCFADETNRTSQAKSDSYQKKLNARKGACNEARSKEKKDFGMCDSKRKRNFDPTNKESNEE